MDKVLLKMMLPRIKSNRLLLSIEEYLKLFDSVLGRDRGGHTLRPYFNSMSEALSGDAEVGMLLRFSKSEWFPGGAWPGNYGLYHIRDYRLATDPKGKKKVKVEGGYNYVDWAGMNDPVPYPLKTTKQNILDEVKRKRYSLYNVPHRFFNKYKDVLTIKIGGTVCGPTEIPKKLLVEILGRMTPFERSLYEQSLYKINVGLYPSVEQPVLVRITGDDDGAEEALFPSVEKAREAMEEIALFNLQDRRHQFGFYSTD